MDYYYADVERITGVSRLRLHHWIKERFLSPHLFAQGHGTKNIYTRGDIYGIALFKRLIESGMHGRIAAVAMHHSFELVREEHQRQKSENGPGVMLCIATHFSDGKEAGVSSEVLDDLWDRNRPSLSERISTYFNEDKYDQVILINLSKLFDEIDSLM